MGKSWCLSTYIAILQKRIEFEMKFIQILILIFVFCSVLSGCPEKPKIESRLQFDKAQDDSLKSSEQGIENPSSTAPSSFSVKDYVKECTLLTSNQSLCNELGESLQHTLKGNMTDDMDGNL